MLTHCMLHCQMRGLTSQGNPKFGIGFLERETDSKQVMEILGLERSPLGQVVSPRMVETPYPEGVTGSYHS